MAKEKLYIGIWQHEQGSDFDNDMRPIVGTYDAVLKRLGEEWKAIDTGFKFDLKKKKPFWVDPKSGYDTDVSITVNVSRKGKRIYRISHAQGAGRVLTIVEADVLQS